MRAVAKIDERQISGMDLEITFRMSVDEWRSLMSQQQRDWPSSDFGRHVSAVLGHVTSMANAVFTDPLHEADK